MDPALYYALRLAKEGYGPADHILQQPVDLVLANLEFSAFLGDYETTAAELNKETK